MLLERREEKQTRLWNSAPGGVRLREVSHLLSPFVFHFLSLLHWGRTFCLTVISSTRPVCTSSNGCDREPPRLFIIRSEFLFVPIQKPCIVQRQHHQIFIKTIRKQIGIHSIFSGRGRGETMVSSRLEPSF